MPRLRLALLSLVTAAALAACGSAAATPSAAPSAAAPSSLPSAAPTASPAVSAAPVSAGPASAAPMGDQTISLSEWKVVVASTIKSGKANLMIANMGTTPHELLVFKSDLEPAAYPTDAAGNIKEEGAGVTLVSDGKNIDPAGKPGTHDRPYARQVRLRLQHPGSFQAGDVHGRDRGLLDGVGEPRQRAAGTPTPAPGLRACE